MKRFFSALVIFLASGILALGDSSKISPDLLAMDPHAKVRVIVQYAKPPAPPASGGLLGLPILGGLVGSLESLPLLGGVLNLVFNVINAVVCTVPVLSLPNIANDPNVTYISPDRSLAPLLDYSAAAVNASAAWHANLTGRGVAVAVIDSGIDVSPDLSVLGLLPRVVYTQDFTGGNGRDQYGHGTHVAGIV
ncbi:MAG: S8 family serine peptidase, partial [Bryobacteraceae bacterium]